MPAASPGPSRKRDAKAFGSICSPQRALDRRGVSVRASAETFREAISLDSLFAEAHSGLSMALALYPYFQEVPAPDLYDEIRTSAKTALRIDSTLSQPHTALGLAYQHDLHWTEAEEEHRTAVLRNAHDVEAHVQLGRHLLSRGCFADGRKQFLLAQADDPASALVSSWVAYANYLEGNLDSAIAEGQRASHNDANNLTAVAYSALFQFKRGNAVEARRLTAFAPRYPLSLYVLAALGDADTVQARLTAMQLQVPAPSLLATDRAYAKLGFGDTAQALAALERATDTREIWPNLHGGTSDPLFNAIRSSQRFKALERRVRSPSTREPAHATGAPR